MQEHEEVNRTGQSPDAFLGSLRTWPEGLKMLLGIIIHAEHPMFLIWGPDRLCFYNDASIFNLHAPAHPQAMGGPVQKIWPDLWLIMGASIDEAMVSGRATWHERQMIPISKDGTSEETYWNYGCSPIYSEGKLSGSLVICIDETEKVRLEKRLASVQESLQNAEQANQAKTEFLAAMSHEIRTPIGAILGYTELLRDPQVDASSRDQFLEVISRNGKALTRIIDDILDLSKVEAGRLDIEAIDFCFPDLIAEVVDLFRESANAKGLYLKLSFDDKVPALIRSDPSRIRQMLNNLMSNAIKFTEAGGIDIRVSSEPQNELLKLCISVQDSGIGLSAEQAQKLFQPFMQAENSTTRKFGGTGLGLALSRRLAMAMQGDIVIGETREGVGSTFILSFACLNVERSSVGKTEIVRAGASSGSSGFVSLEGLKVLVAEDVTDNQILVKRILKRQGAAAECVSNGADAYQKALNGDYDLILMDIQMPGTDGHEATRMLRKAGFEKPIIALTAHAMHEERAKTLASGCDGHLTKPLDPEELVRTVAHFARLSHKKR